MPPRVTCECGECRTCKHREYMRAYYRRPGAAARIRAAALSSRNRRIESVRAADRTRGFRVYDEAKVRARAAVQRALGRGDLTRQPCEVCGDEKVDGHHDDYGKPLEVRWLCRTHHGELHRVVAA